MSCAFDLTHYRELLESAGGYTWATFDREPRGGDLFPHLYGALPVARVLGVTDAPLGADGVPRLSL